MGKDLDASFGGFPVVSHGARRLDGVERELSPMTCAPLRIVGKGLAYVEGKELELKSLSY